MSGITRRQQTCSMCQAQPQDMLILSCRHNLCLECATEVYNLNAKNDCIVCEICLSETGLDQDTVVCLRSLGAKGIRENNKAMSIYQQGYEVQDNQNMRHNYPPIPKSHYKPTTQFQQLAQIQQQLPTPKCQKHNEPLTYYCLECNFYKICSQCMLLQNHRYHKVVTLKKASVQIRETIEKVGREKMKLKGLLEKDRERLEGRKQESQNQLEMNLVELKEVFDEMIRVVGRRYQELKRQVEQEAQRKLQIMEGALNQISQKITLIEQTVQFQDELIKSSLSQQGSGVFQMFQYYESEMTRNQIDFEPSLPNFISEISSQKLINKERVFAELEHLLGELAIGPQDGLQEHSEDNINLISHIDDNYSHNAGDGLKQKRAQYSMMKKRNHQQQQENVYIADEMPYRKPVSENINIIQLGKQSTIRDKRDQAKKSKQSIEAIKRKARQNIKDRELSHSRKMELSRSIENATDILNKIQERSQKI